ncbi:hypothetical protein DLAC_00903 [Tieghemostelium lacteum]|uniref:Uncharacterized protein n=1 Tax=Tieghemostelium lacteum TaxID=361077 RepID=A0A152A779_TIELA|nr:hypothetical protein DLAC_00903 [Tieghemostelium lacteum]|eukprot:KYR02103.1 hypothetical protein DLAC_00903 [Tieghemostelium lacteum]
MKFQFPNYIIIQIIKDVLDFEYVPYKYKLSLCLINKLVFNFISENYCNSLTHSIFELSSKLIESTNEKREYCLFKKLKKLKITMNYENVKDSVNEEKKYEFTKHIEELEIYYLHRGNTNQYPPLLQLTTDQFPVLKSLILNLFDNHIIQKLDIENQFPLVEELKVLTHFERVPVLIKILERVKPTLKRLTISISSSINSPHPSSTLNDYLVTYKPNQLQEVNIDFSSVFQIKSILQNQIQSLTTLSCIENSYNFISSQDQLSILEQSDLLKKVSLIIYNVDHFNRMISLINTKPQIKHLEITISDELLSTQGPYEVYQWKELLHLEVLNMDYQCNFESLFKNNIHSPLKILSFDNCVLGHNSLPSFISYIKANQNLTSLTISYLELLGDSQSEALSLAISQHPSLTTLSIHMKEEYKITKYLHKSSSLEFITLLVYPSPIPTKISAPFELIRLRAPNQYDFIRNGIHYYQPTLSSHLFNFIKDKISDLNKFYLE